LALVKANVVPEPTGDKTSAEGEVGEFFPFIVLFRPRCGLGVIMGSAELLPSKDEVGNALAMTSRVPINNKTKELVWNKKKSKLP
jgi:hypothetical protein